MLNHRTEQAAAFGVGEGTSSRRVRRVAVALAGGVVGLAAEGALAQSSGGASKEPPAAPIATIGRSSDANFVTILLVMVLAIAIVAVNFIPSKRGHQD